MPATSAVVASTAGFAVLVGHDGQLLWRLARVALVVVLGALAWRAATGRPALRAGALLVVAAVAVPTGVGIAAPHLTKVGVGLVGVAGVLVLVGGLVALITGLRALVALGPRRATVPAAIVAVVALVAIGVSLGQAVAVTNVPRTDLHDRTPADLGLGFQEVTFPAGDGVELSGWYVPSANGAAVVLRHGAGSTRSGVLDQAGVLADAGYGVLLTDARGHGRSAGRAMDFGWYGDEDVGGAVAFLAQQPDVDPDRIGAVGMSMGGEEVLGATAAVDALRAVVAEGATYRVAEDDAWLSDEHGWRGALTERITGLTTTVTDLLTEASPPIPLRDAVRASATPTLLIAGGSVADEPPAARHIAGGSPDTVEVWVVPGAGHTAGLDTAPAQWRARVVGFLDEVLAAG